MARSTSCEILCEPTNQSGEKVMLIFLKNAIAGLKVSAAFHITVTITVTVKVTGTNSVTAPPSNATVADFLVYWEGDKFELCVRLKQSLRDAIEHSTNKIHFPFRLWIDLWQQIGPLMKYFRENVLPQVRVKTR